MSLATNPCQHVTVGWSNGVSWSEMMTHRTYLIRFAQRRLHDRSLAEDAVHDVFEAVISGRAAFAGRSALRSWLTAVLKNKIVDTLRRHSQHESLDDQDSDHGGLEVRCALPQPDELAGQRMLLQRTLARIEELPPSLRDVIRLRVLEERSTESVCETLSISQDNLFVRMHRARKQLLS
jgi:RNA polymerase sigma-70 factor (ECF subfamily)